LHSHLVTEWPKTVPKLFDQFTKFSKSEIQLFHKLKQQRKVAKPDEASRACYGDKHHSYPKPVHNIGPDSGGASENLNKSDKEPSHHSDSKTLDKRPPKETSMVELRTEVVDEAKAHTHRDPCTACTMATKPTITPKTALYTSTPSGR
jgi:hypothetical protein